MARVLVCVPSLWKYDEINFDMVVMDESERNLLALTASALMKTPDKMLSCAAALEHAIKWATSSENEHAAGVYLLDADISAKSLVFACDMVGPERVRVIRNLSQASAHGHSLLGE